MNKKNNLKLRDKQPTIERKGGIPQKELNEIGASNLSDMEFKIMVIRILEEVSENY